MITATNKATGEVVELPADTLDSIVSAWRIAQEYEKTAKALKDQLKKAVQQHIAILASLMSPAGIDLPQ